MRRTTYEDEYARREVSGRRDPREDRHGRDRVEARDRTRIDDPRAGRGPDSMDIVDPRMDPRMQNPRGLGDPRGANAAARLEPRQDRHGGTPTDPRARGQQPTYYEDPRTGKLVEVRGQDDLYGREPPSRYANPKDDRMDTDMMDSQPSRRQVYSRETVDTRESYVEDSKSTKYNDYFVPGTGIDREVIQHEICRYLGNDATVRPFTNPKDGRSGFLVRAYRALTSAMIEDLKTDSAKWRKDQERKSRQGRSTGSYANYAAEHQTGIKGRQETDFADTMEVDDYPYEQHSRHRDVDPRLDPRMDPRMDPRDLRDPRDIRERGDRGDPRDLRGDPRDPRYPTGLREDPRMGAGRHGQGPVSTSGYPPEAYPAYTIGPNQTSGAYQTDSIPRYGGNNTPPHSRPAVSGYSQSGYTGRSATAQGQPPGGYRDPRTGQMITGYESSGYNDPGRRHR